MPKKLKYVNPNNPFLPKLELGAYEVNSKSAKQMSPTLLKMTQERGELSLRAVENPFETLLAHQGRLRLLFTPKERRKLLTQGIKRKLLAGIKVKKLAQQEEAQLHELVSILSKLNEQQLLNLLKIQHPLTQREFVQYLITHKPKLLRQQELKL
jgi:predicted methyltransferase